MQFKTIVLAFIGFVFLILGAIGLVLPVWPTTPFVLVSVGCFSSTPRIKGAILKIPFFRNHIENYEKRTGLSKKTVFISMLWLWGMLILSMIALKTVWLTVLLMCVGVAVTTHILWVAKPKIESLKTDQCV